MTAAGFDVTSSAELADSLLYVADVEHVRLDELAPILGMDIGHYPVDDGRSDWRDAYLELVRSSLAIPAPPAPPRGVLVKEALSSIRTAGRCALLILRHI